jgi:hypothetical protein
MWTVESSAPCPGRRETKARGEWSLPLSVWPGWGWKLCLTGQEETLRTGSSATSIPDFVFISLSVTLSFVLEPGKQSGPFPSAVGAACGPGCGAGRCWV